MIKVRPFQIITLPSAEVAAARSFAKKRAARDSYSDSGQDRKDKLERDVLCGALVELALTHFLPECPQPDLKYYAKEGKSWDSDFRYRGQPIAVKGMWKSAAAQYGLSWTFQYDSESGRKDKLINDPKGICAFGVVKDNEPARVAILHMVWTKQVIPSTLELPKLDSLRRYKRCIYASTLRTLIDEGRITDLTKELHEYGRDGTHHTA